MSDEEKKAIEHLKDYLGDLDLAFNGIITTETAKDYKIILNLIEKQSKEIEEYKKQLDLDYVDKHFVPVERYNQLEKEIEELEKNRKVSQNFAKIVATDYISKDKIKAKIEEYDDKGMTINLTNRSAGKTFQQAVHYEVKKVLQSLLKEE